MLYVATYDGVLRSVDDSLKEKNILLDYHHAANDHITSIDKNERFVCMSTLGGSTLFLDHKGELEMIMGTIIPDSPGVDVKYHKDRFYVLNQHCLAVYDGKGREKYVRPIKECASCLSVGDEVLVGTNQKMVYKMARKGWDLFADFNLPVCSVGQKGGKAYFGLSTHKQGLLIADEKVHDLSAFPHIYCNDHVYVTDGGKVCVFTEGKKTLGKNLCRERISNIRQVEVGSNTFLAATAGNRLYLLEDDLNSKIIKIFPGVITAIR